MFVQTFGGKNDLAQVWCESENDTLGTKKRNINNVLLSRVVNAENKINDA